MGLFNWFSSDEIDFLVNTFDIKLPKVDGKLSAINEVQQLRDKLDQQKLILQNYYTHPLMENDQAPVKEALRSHVLSAIETVDAFLGDLENGTKVEPKKIQGKLKDAHAKAEKAIQDAKKKLDELKKQQKALQKRIVKATSEKNAFIGLLQEVKDIHRSIDEILSEDIPQQRKDSADELKQAQQTDPTSPQLQVAPDTRAIVTAQLPRLNNVEVEALRAKINTQSSGAQALKERLQAAVQKWNKEITDLLPSHDFPWDHSKSCHKKYETLRTEIKDSDVITEQQKKTLVAELDAAYLVPFLAKKKKEAGEGYTNKKGEWDRTKTSQEQKRNDVEQKLIAVREQMSKLIPVMTNDELTRYDSLYKAAKASLGSAEYDQCHTEGETLKTTLNGDNVLQDRAQTLAKAEKDWSLSKVADLGKEIEDVQNKAQQFNVQLQPAEDVSKAILGAPESFAMRFISPTEYINIMEQAKQVLAQQKQFLDLVISTLGEAGATLEKASNELSKREKSLRDNDDKIAEEEKEIARLEKALETNGHDITVLKQSEAELNRKIEATSSNSKKKRYNKALAKTQKKIAALEQEKESLQGEKDGKDQTLVALKDTKNDLQDKVRRQEKRVRKAQKKVEAEAAQGLPASSQTAWTETIAAYREARTQKIDILKALSAEEYTEQLLGSLNTQFEQEQTEWSHLIKDPNPTEETLAPHIEALRLIVAALRDVEISAETISAENANRVASELAEQQRMAIAQIQEMERLEPESSDQFDTWKQQVNGATDTDSLNDIVQSFHALRSVILSRKMARETLLQELIDYRDLVGAELQIRLDMRNDVSTITRKVRTSEQCLDMAYSAIDAELKIYNDAYLNSLVNNLALLNTTKTDLETLRTTLQNIDVDSENALIKQFESLTAELKKAKKQLSRAKLLHARMPKRSAQLQTDLTEMQEGLAKQVPDTTQKRLNNWKLVFESASSESVILDADIQELVNKCTNLQDNLKKNLGVFSPYPKVLAKLQDGLKNIKSSCSTQKTYKACFNQFTDLEALYQDIFTDPRQGASAESAEVSRENAEERLKQEWETLLEAFKNKQLPALSALVKEQKQNPELDAGERKRLDASLKQAKDAVSSAEKAGKKERYEEGRKHLSDVRRIQSHLKRFPNGVNAHRLDGLRKISTIWKEGVANLHGSLDDIIQSIEGAVPAEQNALTGQVVSSINAYKAQFTPGDFDVAIAKILQKQGIPKWKEVGMSIVRDYQQILKSEETNQLRTSPFVKLRTDAVEKTLGTIEKTFLLFPTK